MIEDVLLAVFTYLVGCVIVCVTLSLITRFTGDKYTTHDTVIGTICLQYTAFSVLWPLLILPMLGGFIGWYGSDLLVFLFKRPLESIHKLITGKQ